MDDPRAAFERAQRIVAPAIHVLQTVAPALSALRFGHV
jgi:hypothetical protein